VRALIIQNEGAFGIMPFVAFRGHIDETCSLPICIYGRVFVTIYGNNSYCYYWSPSVIAISPIGKTLCEAFLRTWSTTDLYSNVWRLMDSEFDKLKLSSFYFFIKKSIVIPRKLLDMGCHLFCWERFNSISLLSGQSVYYHTPWLLFVQCVEHSCICYAKSAMNTKAIYILPEWPQFISATADLKLLRQISTVRLLFEKETYLSLSFLAYSLRYWVIDKDICVKMSSTHV
jgi:hypothetical protein